MHERWVRDAVDMRDEITHISDLRGSIAATKTIKLTLDT
jgi:hypothetical protein